MPYFRVTERYTLSSVVRAGTRHDAERALEIARSRDEDNRLALDLSSTEIAEVPDDSPFVQDALDATEWLARGAP